MMDSQIEALIGEAWDDGNAVGLDGYVGPGRGAGEVDPEAVRARDRILAKLPPRPTRAQIEEIIATRVMRYDSAADVRAVDDNDPEALDAGTDALLALINGSES